MTAIGPEKTCLFVPPGLKKFKMIVFERIAAPIKKAGGHVIRSEFAHLDQLPDDIVPIVGCTAELRPYIDRWLARGRTFIYWDRGYCRRIQVTWLPRSDDGTTGYYRWHINSFQMREIRDVPDDRWRRLKTEVKPWQRDGEHIVVAAQSATYEAFHNCRGWTAITVATLKRLTNRRLVVREKLSETPLPKELEGAHCLVTHTSNAAVEAVIMGCPVFVHPGSAAALVGKINLEEIEEPAYPDRQPWLNSLAYSNFSERELIDGTLWRLIS